MMLTYKQVFYSGKSAFEVELSKNGIFCTIADCIGKNENGNLTFDWKKKSTAKMSISELAHLSEGLKAFRHSSDFYFQKAQKLTGDSKYKNYQFIHKSNNGTGRIGWNCYDSKLSFVINFPSNDKKYLVQEQDIARLDKFMTYIVDKAFEFDAFELAEKVFSKNSRD